MFEIGVDIGGTNIKYGLVNEALEIVAHGSIPFPKTTACLLYTSGFAGLEDPSGFSKAPDRRSLRHRNVSLYRAARAAGADAHGR